MTDALDLKLKVISPSFACVHRSDAMRLLARNRLGKSAIDSTDTSRYSSSDQRGLFSVPARTSRKSPMARWTVMIFVHDKCYCIACDASLAIVEGDVHGGAEPFSAMTFVSVTRVRILNPGCRCWSLLPSRGYPAHDTATWEHLGT